MTYDVPQLLRMSQKELDDLFSASEPRPIPDGEADGSVIIAPGRLYFATIRVHSERLDCQQPV
jgi:hypothetical protein